MPSTIDGLLVQEGDWWFCPSNRTASSRTSVATEAALRQHAQVLRQRIRATVRHRAPQVMVNVTGGGCGMGAIAAHRRDIAKPGRLPIENDRAAVRAGREALRAIADQRRFRGTRIPELSERREAFNTTLSMPTATDAARCNRRRASSPRPSWRITAAGWSCARTGRTRRCSQRARGGA